MKIFISYKVQGGSDIHSVTGRLDEFKWDIEGDLDIDDILVKIHHNHGLTHNKGDLYSLISLISINMLPNIKNKWK